MNTQLENSEMCPDCNNGGRWTGITWTTCSTCSGTSRVAAPQVSEKGEAKLFMLTDSVMRVVHDLESWRAVETNFHNRKLLDDATKRLRAAVEQQRTGE